MRVAKCVLCRALPPKCNTMSRRAAKNRTKSHAPSDYTRSHCIPTSCLEHNAQTHTQTHLHRMHRAKTKRISSSVGMCKAFHPTFHAILFHFVCHNQTWLSLDIEQRQQQVVCVCVWVCVCRLLVCSAKHCRMCAHSFVVGPTKATTTRTTTTTTIAATPVACCCMLIRPKTCEQTKWSHLLVKTTKARARQTSLNNNNN